MSFQQLTLDSTLARAHLLMRHEGSTCLPVFENGRIVGVISEVDIRKAIDLQAREEAAPLTVRNYMTPFGPSKP